MELINSLTRFESFSQHCETLNRDDAHMHNEIYKLAAQARSKIERAMALMLESEKVHFNHMANER